MNLFITTVSYFGIFSTITVGFLIWEKSTVNIFGLVHHEILLLMAHAQKPPLKAHADIFSRVRGTNFGMYLHLHPCFVYASS